MAGVYALIGPDGALTFRDGVPDAMFKDTDPAHADPVAFTILHSQGSAQGLCGYTEDPSSAPSDPPPNPVGQALVAAFGAPDPPIHGALAICGTRTLPSSSMSGLCGLSEAQQRLIRAAHANPPRNRERLTARPRPAGLEALRGRPAG
jgi:hypothetical protein